MPNGAYAAYPWAQYAPYLIMAVFIGLAMRRNLRARPLRPELLWINPAIILAASVLVFVMQPPEVTPLLVALLPVSLAVGAAFGWWRGRVTTMTVDPQTHAVTVQVSPVGSLLFVGVIGARYLFRGVLAQNAGTLHLSVIQITDAFLVLAVGLVCAQRLELWLRARRLREEAKRPASQIVS
jgi:hypothetical protein